MDHGFLPSNQSTDGSEEISLMKNQTPIIFDRLI
jgi:hypothetical protein